MRRRLLGRITGGDPLASLLPAVKAVVPGGRQPIGQNREGFPARLTDSAPYPDAFVLVIVALTKPPSVAYNRFVAANWTSPRQQVQRDRPRVDLVFLLWQCDKENHGWREGPPLTVPCQSFDPLAGPSPSGKVSFERKKNTAFRCRSRASHLEHWPDINGIPSK
jgi:hypothetical protein